jgi:hypothetical protein
MSVSCGIEVTPPPSLCQAFLWYQHAFGVSLSLTIGFNGELLGPFSCTSIVLVRNADARETLAPKISNTREMLTPGD